MRETQNHAVASKELEKYYDLDALRSAVTFKCGIHGRCVDNTHVMRYFQQANAFFYIKLMIGFISVCHRGRASLLATV